MRKKRRKKVTFQNEEKQHAKVDLKFWRWIHFMGNRAGGREEATFLNFPWKTTGVLLLCPPWTLSPPCRISGLFLWGALAHFRRTFCVRAAQASQKCHCTTGLEISWCLSSGSQQMPLFSSRQIQGFIGNLAGLQSGICLSFQELPEKEM